jgi:Phage integrase, N-terminal SAM-like domain
MTDKAMSPLRRRMIDDMTMRNLSPSTQETYIRAVAEFSTFHRRSPDKLGVEHLRDYHLHLVSRGLTANSIWVKMVAILLPHNIAAAGHSQADPDAPPIGQPAHCART